jgi:hypothetical protein
MSEDLLDCGALLNRGDELERSAAVRTRRQIDLKDAF